MLVDLALPGQKIAVEVDGLSHNTYAVRERDSRKDSLLAEAGWSVLRITNSEILSDLGGAVSKVHEFCASVPQAQEAATT
jgi:very-short-patch-repair endonuclease